MKKLGKISDVIDDIVDDADEMTVSKGEGGIRFDEDGLIELEKSATPNQKIAMRYFNGTPEFLFKGCFNKKTPNPDYVSDEMFDKMVASEVASLNIMTRAINKIGLDESELKLQDPIIIQGYSYDKNNVSMVGRDGEMRTDLYEVTMLMFSDEQIYIYKITFSLLVTRRREMLEEFFYKDVTSISASNDYKQVKFKAWAKDGKEGGCMGFGKVDKYVLVSKTKETEVEQLKVVVPGSSIVSYMDNMPEVESRIREMKNLLREKKR